MKKMVIVADSSFVIETIRLALRSAAGLNVIGKVDGRAPRAPADRRVAARDRAGRRDAELRACARAHPRVPRGGALERDPPAHDAHGGRVGRPRRWPPVPTPASRSPPTCRASAR